MALFLALFIAVVIVAIVFGLVWLGADDKAEQIARRLEGISPAPITHDDTTAEAQLVRDEELSTVPWLNRALANWSRIGYVRTTIAQAGMDTKPGQILLMTCVCFAGTFFVARLFQFNPAFALLFAILVGALPICNVYFRRAKRMNAFEKSFPEAIDLMARAVKAGHGLNTGMEIVGQEMNEPISGEFRKTFEEQHLGLQLREALVNLTMRVPLQDVRFFAAALIIQDETGGNLAEILTNLSGTIRERFKIRGEVKVKTAQGRLTAVILCSLPPAMLLMLHILNPDYARPLYTDIIGIVMLCVAACMQIIGALILWKIVSIKV